MNILNFYEKKSRESLRSLLKFRQYHYWNKLYKNNIKGLSGEGLTEDEKKSIMEFYKPFHKVHLTFHNFYKKSTGKYYTEYIPDDLYYAYIDPYFNDWEVAKYLDNKCRYRNMFPGALQPTLVVYRENGYWYDNTGELISEQSAISKVVIIRNNCFVKQAVESSGGHGIEFVPQDMPSEDVKKIIEKYHGRDLVIQEGLKQSETLAKINESSVNTIRLITLFKKDGSVKIYSSVLRMGINGAKVDNASSGGITVGIEDNGRLKPIAYNTKGEKFNEHPTSHVKFNDFIIPNFEIIKDLVKKQATYLPYFRLVSWDIAINEKNQPVIIEANLCFGELDFHQLNNGPLFGDDTEDILKEVFTK